MSVILYSVLKNNQPLLNTLLNNFCSFKEIFPIAPEEQNNYPLLKGIELARLNNSPSDSNFLQTVNDNFAYRLDTEINSHAFAIELLFSIESAGRNRKNDIKKLYLSILEKLEEIDQNELSSNPFGRQISVLKERVENYKFVVPVVGAFNAGKSNLLNVFMQRNILPIDNNQKTAVATELHYGKKEYRGSIILMAVMKKRELII